jgi:hypothetical protein
MKRPVCDEQQTPLLQLSHEPASPAQLTAWRKLWSLLLSESRILRGSATDEREEAVRDGNAS